MLKKGSTIPLHVRESGEHDCINHPGTFGSWGIGNGVSPDLPRVWLCRPCIAQLCSQLVGARDKMLADRLLDF